MIGNSDTASRFQAFGFRIDKVPYGTRLLELAQRRKPGVFKALIEIVRLQVVMEFDVADFGRSAKDTEIVLENVNREVRGTVVDPAGSIRVHECIGCDWAEIAIPTQIVWSKQHG